MFRGLGSFLIYGLSEMAELSNRNKEKLKEIEGQWHETKNMPRKMKKHLRKRLILEYSLFKSFENDFDVFTV